MTEIVTGTVIVALMALFTWLSLRYFKKIGRGAAAPVIDPSWPTIMRPPHNEMTVDDETSAKSVINRHLGERFRAPSAVATFAPRTPRMPHR